MRYQYTRQELESITQETAIYIEGAGIAQPNGTAWRLQRGAGMDTCTAAHQAVCNGAVRQY